MDQKELSHPLLVGIQNSIATLEDSLVVSYKTKYSLISGPVIMLLYNYPNELKTYFHIKILTCMFITTLFIIFKTWKQLRCLSTSE